MTRLRLLFRPDFRTFRVNSIHAAGYTRMLSNARDKVISELEAMVAEGKGMKFNRAALANDVGRNAVALWWKQKYPNW